MVIELRKPFINYGPNKHRSCNWVVSHLRITDFYDFYDETNGPYIPNIYEIIQKAPVGPGLKKLKCGVRNILIILKVWVAR